MTKAPDRFSVGSNASLAEINKTYGLFHAFDHWTHLENKRMKLMAIHGHDNSTAKAYSEASEGQILVTLKSKCGYRWKGMLDAEQCFTLQKVA